MQQLDTNVRICLQREVKFNGSASKRRQNRRRDNTASKQRSYKNQRVFQRSIGILFDKESLKMAVGNVTNLGIGTKNSGLNDELSKN